MAQLSTLGRWPLWASQPALVYGNGHTSCKTTCFSVWSPGKKGWLPIAGQIPTPARKCLGQAGWKGPSIRLPSCHLTELLEPTPGGDGCLQLQLEMPVHRQALPPHPACPCSPVAPHFGVSSQPGKRGMSPRSREKSATCCSTHSSQKPLLAVGRLVITPHTSSLQDVRYHHAFVTPRLTLAVPALPDPASALVVARQRKRAGHSELLGQACPPLPGLRPHHRCLDPS